MSCTLQHFSQEFPPGSLSKRALFACMKKIHMNISCSTVLGGYIPVSANIMFMCFFVVVFSQAPADFQYYSTYLAEPQVRKAIHVGNLTFHDGNKVEQHLINDILQSITPQLAKVMENYKVLHSY